MHNDIFYRFGKLLYRFRWVVILLWALLLIACIPFVTHLMEPFNAIGFTDPHSESAKANDLLNEKLGYSYNQFIVLYETNKSFSKNPELLDEIKTSLSGLKKIPAKHQIIYPDKNNKQISPDKQYAYAVILFKSGQEADQELLKQFKAALKKPPHLRMQLGGEPIFLEDTKKQTQIDLFKSEYIATPVAIITMLIVFESVVAASLPILLGGIGALLILMTLFTVAHYFSLSVFTINIALLLGLCLSLDYALLLVNRFREELRAGRNAIDAIAVTQATAGKAVFFSGLAVFISLSALLFFKINVLFSVGVGGLAAVLVSISIALILLPAVLSILDRRINLLPIRLFRFKRFRGKNYWRWSVKKVVRRPWLFFTICLIFLLGLGYPFLKVKFGISDFRILPETQESRRVFDTFQREFGESKLAPVFAIIETSQKNILTKNNISDLYDFGSKLKRDKRVKEVNSIVTTEPRLSKEEYQTMYTTYKDHLDKDLKKLLDVTTQDNLTVMTIVTKYDSNSEPTAKFIQSLRHKDPGDRLSLSVTGTSVNTFDALKSISATFPKAFIWIVVFTYFILLILLRSLILPLKAILTTILSLVASYGVLVFVIQQGFLHEVLNFEPQGMLDISLLIIIFCALFGISMDYEVFLLSRIKEYFEQTGDTIKSIELGITRSSKIISSAAIIVIVICFSFMAADILIVKAFGMGIAIAVFVDAFIIRTVLVPATMAILNTWNWYLPKWMGKILPKVSFDPEHL